MLYALMGLGLSLIAGVLNIRTSPTARCSPIGAYLLVTVVGAIGNFWIALLLAPLGWRSSAC